MALDRVRCGRRIDSGKETVAMPVRELSIKVTTEGGKLRADLPATSIEAEDAEGLMRQADQLTSAIMACVQAALGDAAEEIALRNVEKNALGRDDLERLAALHPAPPEWFDEPE
jgi:hypothetical protein